MKWRRRERRKKPSTGLRRREGRGKKVGTVLPCSRQQEAERLSSCGAGWKAPPALPTETPAEWLYCPPDPLFRPETWNTPEERGWLGGNGGVQWILTLRRLTSSSELILELICWKGRTEPREAPDLDISTPSPRWVGSFSRQLLRRFRAKPSPRSRGYSVAQRSQNCSKWLPHTSLDVFVVRDSQLSSRLQLISFIRPLAHSLPKTAIFAWVYESIRSMCSDLWPSLGGAGRPALSSWSL